MFSLIRDEITYYEPPKVSVCPGNDQDDNENPFYYSMEKTLTDYMLQIE